MILNSVVGPSLFHPIQTGVCGSHVVHKFLLFWLFCVKFLLLNFAYSINISGNQFESGFTCVATVYIKNEFVNSVSYYPYRLWSAVSDCYLFWLYWQQDEICSLRAQIDSLIQQQQQTDVILSSLQCCLCVIEADPQLSESTVDAVRHAKQSVNSCIETRDAASSSTWLQRQSDTQLSDSQVCAS